MSHKTIALLVLLMAIPLASCGAPVQPSSVAPQGQSTAVPARTKTPLPAPSQTRVTPIPSLFATVSSTPTPGALPSQEPTQVKTPTLAL
jgi:hypothetical protein